ncbi:MAG: G-D-S-L family lipolytic protein [Chitinophagia bacterium]|jgi:lysophospholipase L1-like esterase|nr:G-D-S-L family lipolytic protein [Chitinophagia bacterium]
MGSKLLLLTTFIACMFALSFKSDKKKKIVFFGDSITQAAVNKGGYIDVLQNMLQQKGVDQQFELNGAGISGNKVYDLYLRMETDVLDKKPDVVVIWIGVNDVWHKSSSGTGTDFDKFGKFYDAVVKKIQKQGAKVIIVTPAAIGEKNDYSNPQDGDLNSYSNWMRKYAATNQLGLVDLRKIFHEYSIANNPNNDAKGILTTDGVHLNEKGNALVAEEMWKAISN